MYFICLPVSQSACCSARNTVPAFLKQRLLSCHHRPVIPYEGLSIAPRCCFFFPPFKLTCIAMLSLVMIHYSHEFFTASFYIHCNSGRLYRPTLNLIASWLLLFDRQKEFMKYVHSCMTGANKVCYQPWHFRIVCQVIMMNI